MMKISIVTICYNAESNIRQTIDSVLSQTYKNIEYLIIDGYSTDRTIDIIKSYNDNRIVLYSEKDDGISHAFNKGILRSTGDSILFLNAGDYFTSIDVIDNYVSDYCANHKDVIFYKVHVLNDIYIPKNEYHDDAERIWNLSEVPHQGAFVHKTVFEKVGCFNPLLRIRMDYEFFIKAQKSDVSYLYIPKVIVEYEPGGVSMKKENKFLFFFEYIKINRFYKVHTPFLSYLKTVKKYIELKLQFDITLAKK